MEAPSRPESDSRKKPVYVGKVETTGNLWTDFQEAVNVSDDARCMTPTSCRTHAIFAKERGWIGRILDVSVKCLVSGIVCWRELLVGSVLASSGASLHARSVFFLSWFVAAESLSVSAGPFVASNWAVGTFMVISTGTWCARSYLLKNLPVHDIVQDAVSKRQARRNQTTSTRSWKDAHSIHQKGRPGCRFKVCVVTSNNLKLRIPVRPKIRPTILVYPNSLRGLGRPFWQSNQIFRIAWCWVQLIIPWIYLEIQ